MKPSVAILTIDFTARNWSRSCYVIPIKKKKKKKNKNPNLASTRFRIHSGFKNTPAGERIQKVADSPANSPDTCGRKAYPERKSCGALVK